ncbi:MAG: GAF domain-containing sensor histidine kinase [Sandaracinaceae bacterium]
MIRTRFNLAFALVAQLDDPDRLEALRRTGLLDAPPEEIFDRLTKLAARALGAPVALVSLVDDHRQFFKSQVGLAEPWASDRETPLSHSFCQHVVLSEAPLVVSDAREHPVVCDNLAVRDLDVVAYAGVPIRLSRGELLGSFCVIDTQPREWTEQDLDVLSGLADAVIAEIELRLQVDAQTSRGAEFERQRDAERRRARSVTHDLRSPLSVVVSGSELLLDHRQVMDDPGLARIAQLIHRNAVRAARMIEDLHDLHRLEHGSMTFDFREADLVLMARELIEDLHDDRLQLGEAPRVLPHRVDLHSVERVVTNLVTNAQRFARDRVQVHLQRRGQKAHILVDDDGPGVPPEQREQVFEAYARLHGEGLSGSGLGLAVVRELARAHGGTVRVTESPLGGARFEVVLGVLTPVEAVEGR